MQKSKKILRKKNCPASLAKNNFAILEPARAIAIEKNGDWPYLQKKIMCVYRHDP